MIEFINQLRARRKGVEESNEQHIVEAAVEGAVLRLRPIMMTMLVATLGLLPAALSHAIGSDSQLVWLHCYSSLTGRSWSLRGSTARSSQIK